MSLQNPKTPEFYNSAPWGEVTDPTQYNPQSFRYLVHLDGGQRIEGAELGPDGQWKYLIENPHEIASLENISTSLVDQEHPVLFQGSSSSHGFIVEVPFSSVLATSPRDMYSQDETPDSLRTKYPVLDPGELLRQTPDYDHNDVLVSTNGLVIKAVFWVDSQSDDEPPYTIEQVRSAAEMAGLPFIELDLEKF